MARFTGSTLARLAAGALTLCMTTAGCGGTPTSPGQRPVDTSNDIPTITSLTADSPRIEAGDEVGVAAVVQDADTPVEQLSYQWSAAPADGTFTGTGASVRWRAPRQQPSPDLYALNLLVTERFISGGQSIENRAQKTVSIHYNDSPAEITRIGERFLTQLFPDFTVTPQAAVQDFSDSGSCSSEKASELSDVTNNRINFHILSGTYTGVTVNLDTARDFADVSGLCTFVDIPENPANPNVGKREAVSGVCTLTAVYENWRWFLCASHFKGIGVTLLGTSQYRVPGRVLPPTD